MFNKYVSVQAPAYPQYVTVNEHRAPTDESVKILRDAEDRAQKAIVQSTRVENCPIDVVMHQMVDHLNESHKFVCVFKLNNTKHRVEYEHRSKFGASDAEDRIAAAMGVRDAIAKEIASALMEPLCKQFDRRLGV